MKNLKILALTFLFGAFAQAQTLDEAIKKTDNERYEAASADFRQLIEKEPANSKLYFYFGENLFQQDEENNLDLAHDQWKKGIAADPACQLNTVGLGKYLWYKGDTTAGRQYFNTALKASKSKNAEIMRQIAKVLTNAPKKDLKGAIALMDAAIKIDPKNIENFLIQGDALQFLTPANGSPAIRSYNLALGIDPKSAKTLVRTAQLYQRAGNYQLANDKYKEAQTADPTYAPAYRLNGDLNLMFNQSQPAVENYNKYLELNTNTEALYRYGTALFKGKNYCEAVIQLQKLEERGFTNFYTKRMIGYSILECNDAGTKTPENYKKAMDYMDAFFKVVPSDKVIGMDYSKKGLILQRLGSDSLALIEFEKGTIDTNNAGFAYSDMGKIYVKTQNYAKVIETYEKKANGNYSKLTPSENFDLGKAYYFGPMNYVAADSAFARLTRQSSTYAMGFIWKARSAYKLEDPKNNQFLSKAAYEQFFVVLKPEEKANAAYASTIIEAAKYLGDYYVRSTTGKDLTKAKEYWEMVRTLDPNDAQAKAFFASPAGK